MADKALHVVTGAFGYSGRYVAGRLLDQGHCVRTLTNSPNRENPFQGKVDAVPYHFHDFPKMVESLQGAEVFYNNYWIRFNDYALAVENSRMLIRAAKEADVQRIVHISITNPDADSDLGYFRGKALVEQAVENSGIPHTILRPAVIFGMEDILINNIAWVLRKLPVFGLFGDGRYRLQPIFVDDLARLTVEHGKQTGNHVIDAIGPETFTYRELIETIGKAIGKRRPIVKLPPRLGYVAGWLIGTFTGDIMITRDEIEGLMNDRLVTNSRPMVETKLSEWVQENAERLGRHYASELARRRNRGSAYKNIKV